MQKWQFCQYLLSSKPLDFACIIKKRAAVWMCGIKNKIWELLQGKVFKGLKPGLLFSMLVKKLSNCSRRSLYCHHVDMYIFIVRICPFWILIAMITMNYVYIILCIPIVWKRAAWTSYLLLCFTQEKCHRFGTIWEWVSKWWQLHFLDEISL